MYYMQAVEYANDKMYEKYGDITEYTKEQNNEFLHLVVNAMNKLEV